MSAAVRVGQVWCSPWGRTEDGRQRWRLFRVVGEGERADVFDEPRVELEQLGDVVRDEPPAVPVGLVTRGAA